MNTLLTSGLQNFADRIKNDPHWSQYFEADHALLMEAIAELKTKRTAPPAAPVVTTEEGRHCGDPDCVPCRDPAEPAAPFVPDGMALVPADVIEFLRGAAPLDGVWFGDRNPNERGAFWWRKRLSAAHAQGQDNGGAA